MLNQSMFLYSHGYELMVHKVCRSYGYVAIDTWLWVYYNKYMVLDPWTFALA